MDNEKIIGDLLHAHGLKKTPIRMEMLDLFMNHDFALSASDIVAKMKARHDRVTVYRALASFEEHGILHKASEDGQGAKYALCGHDCPDETHADQHAHFVCDECHHTYCLEDVEVPEIKISSEFSVNRVNYTLSGICKECKV
ncbi:MULTISPECIES: Fur family transcriptional regulator [Reichenbachiella]|uniref:Fur family transcriptional regulator, ferric uptake regulator n=1 Tax=Reichenbachiella agariperforans TaxID=156994 RepID=A0A1M6UDI2_REIAG|nr:MULTISPECIES: transcriptional repressor [Reichenbachiella]RJE72563.1 Fur family transcriptional regulator [Reichenbachiella sp. MSK19-1]SHK67118.1 Fur family transcriptional regulator, ferric uptake regulator [Reichenbachiella agariperforans]